MATKEISFNNLAEGEEQLKSMQGYMAADIVNSDCWKELVISAHKGVYSKGSGAQYASNMQVIELEFKKQNKMLYKAENSGRRTYMEKVTPEGRIQLTNRMVSRPHEMTIPIGRKEWPIKSDPMPPAYRSAKSVIKRAIELGVELVDGDGKPLAKTKLSKLCKEQAVQHKLVTDIASGRMFATTSALGRVADALDTIGKEWASLDTHERVALRKYMKATFDIK